jgi:hypothetical protein
MEEIEIDSEDCSCELSVVQGIYQDQQVYFIQMTHARCFGIYAPVKIYSCEGEAIVTFSEDENFFTCSLTRVSASRPDKVSFDI